MKSSPRSCREVLKELLKRAYALNVKHPECGFIIPLMPISRIEKGRVRVEVIHRCLSKLWPFWTYAYSGNYKRVIIVYGISLDDFRAKASALIH